MVIIVEIVLAIIATIFVGVIVIVVIVIMIIAINIFCLRKHKKTSAAFRKQIPCSFTQLLSSECVIIYKTLKHNHLPSTIVNHHWHSLSHLDSYSLIKWHMGETWLCPHKSRRACFEAACGVEDPRKGMPGCMLHAGASRTPCTERKY